MFNYFNKTQSNDRLWGKTNSARTSYTTIVADTRNCTHSTYSNIRWKTSYSWFKDFSISHDSVDHKWPSNQASHGAWKEEMPTTPDGQPFMAHRKQTNKPSWLYQIRHYFL